MYTCTYIRPEVRTLRERLRLTEDLVRPRARAPNETQGGAANPLGSSPWRSPKLETVFGFRFVLLGTRFGFNFVFLKPFSGLGLWF